jgi:protein-L-isoaspartate(D-aspartate) O-methyltransferase
MARDDFTEERARLIQEIAAYAYHTGERTGRKSFSAKVMEAMLQVPRHEFVPLEIRRFSYINRPLPIGMDATISQPFIVALMTDLADIGSDDNVLEIGTGAGYQAAILSLLAKRVASVEINEELEAHAKKRLARLGYGKVETRVGDGYYGWPDRGPFDAVLVTTAPDLIPPPLLEQLAPRGRMVIPAGLPDSQKLMLVTRNAQGRFETTEILEVAFSQLQRAGHA